MELTVRIFTVTFLSAILTACSDAEPKPYNLTKEFYTWDCTDYEDYTEINVSTETCDDSVQFIVAELHLTDGHVWKTNLKTDYEGSCQWEESFLLTEEFCIQVEGIALTAWAY